MLASAPILLDKAAEKATELGPQAGAGLLVTYMGAAALTPVLARRVAKPIIEKVHEYHAQRAQQNMSATSLSYVKSVLATAGLAWTLAVPTADATRNILHDFTVAGQARTEQFEQPPARAEIVRPVEFTEELGDAVEGVYLSGDLGGTTISSRHNRLFTGIQGVTPDTVRTNPRDLLVAMWDRKQALSGISPAARAFRDSRVLTYDPALDRRMTLDDYFAHVDTTVVHVQNQLDWSAVQRIYRLSDEQVLLTRKAVNRLTSKHIVSYALTELFETTNTEKNLRVWDFMLRNYGEQFVSMIPAMGDSYSSMGPFQFTSYAVRDDSAHREGASRINYALPTEHRIPGSVNMLSPEQHTKAAVMFAAHNLAEGVRTLSNRRQRDVFNRVLESPDARYDEDLTKYIAVAHHSPAHGRSALRRYLDNNAQTPFVNSVDARRLGYAQKSNANFRGLQE